MKFTVLVTLDNSIDANLLRAKLEQVGIPCFLNNEHITNTLPHYFNMLGSGVQVMVPSDQLSHAQEIAQLNQGVITCPNCGSDSIQNRYEKGWNRIGLVLMVILVVFPIGNLLNNYKCKDCNEEFKR